jgi:hypothetical protein
MCSSLRVRDEVSHPYKTIGKLIVSCILIFKFLERRGEDKIFEVNSSKHSPNLIDYE